jgi:hypothetical protein
MRGDIATAARGGVALAGRWVGLGRRHRIGGWMERMEARAGERDAEQGRGGVRQVFFAGGGILRGLEAKVTGDLGRNLQGGRVGGRGAGWWRWWGSGRSEATTGWGWVRRCGESCGVAFE